MLSKGEDVPFFGGAPLNITAPQPLPSGFAALPGVTLNAGGRLPCAGSLRSETIRRQPLSLLPPRVQCNSS